jgi:hypothetical protein
VAFEEEDQCLLRPVVVFSHQDANRLRKLRLGLVHTLKIARPTQADAREQDRGKKLPHIYTASRAAPREETTAIPQRSNLKSSTEHVYETQNTPRPLPA